MADEDHSSPSGENRVPVPDEEGGHDDSSQPTPSSSADDEPKIGSELSARSPKEHGILDACRRRDIEELQALAMSPGGFLTDELRQQACELCVFIQSPMACPTEFPRTFHVSPGR